MQVKIDHNHSQQSRAVKIAEIKIFFSQLGKYWVFFGQKIQNIILIQFNTKIETVNICMLGKYPRGRGWGAIWQLG